MEKVLMVFIFGFLFVSFKLVFFSLNAIADYLETRKLKKEFESSKNNIQDIIYKKVQDLKLNNEESQLIYKIANSCFDNPRYKFINNILYCFDHDSERLYLNSLELRDYGTVERKYFKKSYCRAYKAPTQEILKELNNNSEKAQLVMKVFKQVAKELKKGDRDFSEDYITC